MMEDVFLSIPSLLSITTTKNNRSKRLFNLLKKSHTKNLIEKWERNLNKHFSKKDILMAISIGKDA